MEECIRILFYFLNFVTESKNLTSYSTSGPQAALMIGLFWLFAKIGLVGCTEIEVYLSKLLNVFVANCKMYFC